MDKKLKTIFVGLLVAAGVLLVVPVLLANEGVALGEENAGKGKSEKKAKLAQAKERMQKKWKKRADAAAESMSIASDAGVSVEQSEEMANEGLRAGLAAEDFAPLGKFVGKCHADGLKGTELADAVHKEVARRKEIRTRERQQKKEAKKNKDKGKDKDKAKGKDKDKDKGKGKDKDKDKGKGKGKGKGK